MKSAVFFDLDGTLVDTAPDFQVILAEMRTREGLPALSTAAVRSQVSNGARALVTLAFGLAPEDNAFEGRLAQLLDAYEQILAEHSGLFPGMDAVLRALEARGMPWGVITNKPRRFTVPLLERLGLGARVGPVVCPDDVVHRKPDPEGLLLACAQAGAAPAQSVYVGDHERDIAAGHNAGMITVAACYGYIPPGEDPENWRADHAIDTPEDMLPLIEHWSRS